MATPTSSRVVVVGAGGTLGALLTSRLNVPGVDFRAGTIGPWNREVGRADVVVNVGGPRVRRGLSDVDYLREHVGVVQDVLFAMKRGAHLVHVSSTAVFGARMPEVGSGTFAADAPEAPHRFPMPGYAFAKLAAETYARAAAPSRRVELTVLRPSMVYGAGLDSAVESLARLARRGARLVLFPGDLRQHLTSVDLFVAAIQASIETPRGADPIVVADPFVLRTSDLAATRGGVPVPLHLGLARRAQVAWRPRGRTPLALDSFAVLALDSVFDHAQGFRRLGLDPERFTRARTFDVYRACQGEAS